MICGQHSFSGIDIVSYHYTCRLFSSISNQLSRPCFLWRIFSRFQFLVSTGFSFLYLLASHSEHHCFTNLSLNLDFTLSDTILIQQHEPMIQLMYVAATFALDSQHCITIEHIALNYILVVPGRLGSYWYIKINTLFVLARSNLFDFIFLKNILSMKHPQLIFVHLYQTSSQT